ncbi:SigE family RNA polymerase sigma factor [Streptomyces sp. NBC_00053]|uniref:SigE family RNA polymerase sigma factor n=1 Tax=unclassified Streptomyces TaxID=2593676 RepID=UPI000F5B8B74|nr:MULTISPECIES: SigE family RNA polymerase sigma factor [unclassified Streptomyces]WSG51838.1 SigE family RNA polymerase sigma factor [Streptomyces sp. NBC_01732]WSX02495.1 SigE family RNA polymerase sigma factor [Streptomyces sp. NBC_00987]MCX4395590.1 SigE family RNA polymerase sigma factor [Streptomyces sp. NBC_01767]MCX5101777.1 SigE family RNA polymerase sigma factor [Streptomyces sp. NBC_00439]MCX5161296.1 SigE family RNA polymerase sigma factor [Streptomyces sp. NBC_00305]
MKSAQEDQYLEFVAERAKALYRSAYVLAAGDTYLAEDLVQETLSRVYVHWKRVARADSPAAYAQTVLVRTSLTLRRRRSTGERPTGNMPDSAAAGPDAALRLTLLDALGQLPPRDRAVLLLRYWEDRSIEETAGMLRLSSSAVRSRGTRALNRVRALLGDSLSDLVPH